MEWRVIYSYMRPDETLGEGTLYFHEQSFDELMDNLKIEFDGMAVYRLEIVEYSP